MKGLQDELDELRARLVVLERRLAEIQEGIRPKKSKSEQVLARMADHYAASVRRLADR